MCARARVTSAGDQILLAGKHTCYVIMGVRFSEEKLIIMLIGAWVLAARSAGLLVAHLGAPRLGSLFMLCSNFYHVCFAERKRLLSRKVF